MDNSTHLNAIGYVVLFGYLPIVLAIFAFFPPRQACIWGFLIAWLFLPMDHVPMRGFTDYNKGSAAAVGILLGCLIFDSETLFAFRPKIWDLPIVIWSICPFFSSIENGLGSYDGLCATVYQTTFWGLPYFIGRLYFSDLAGLRELAKAIVIGGLLYVPLCWYEIRFSPQLHRIVYGHHQHEFGQSVRYGAYRPMVFMQHGLAVGLWMASATVTAFWLFLNRTIPRLMGMPMVFIFLLLIVTTIFCRSMGAISLMLIGIGVLTLTRFVRWPIWVIVLALAPSAYMYMRGSNIWDGKNLVKQIAQTDPRGAASLAVRLQSESLLVHHAMKRPIFGWAGWNRFRIVDEEGNDQAVPDAFWVIALGHDGLLGLVAVTAVLTLPLLLLAWRIPVEYWTHMGAAPAAAMAVIPVLYMCDNLMNAMMNPIFILCAAGVSGLAFSMRSPQSEMQRPLMPRAEQPEAAYQRHPLARGSAARA